MPFNKNKYQRELMRKRRLKGTIVYLYMPKCTPAVMSTVAEELRQVLEAGYFKDFDMRISVSNYQMKEAKTK